MKMLDMQTMQRAYAEAIAPASPVSEGANFRAPAVRSQGQPLPPYRGAKNAATGRAGAALGEFGWWLFVLLALLGVLALMGKFSGRQEEAWRLQEYCAAVYNGRVPDYRQTYSRVCLAGNVRRDSAPSRPAP